MTHCGSLLLFLFLSCFAASSRGATFSSLQRSLIVTASPSQGQVLVAGEDKITVTWSYNGTFAAGTDSSYKTIKVNLCYAPISQVDRAWRKTQDNLEKDKTCPFQILKKPYSPLNNTFTWTVMLIRPPTFSKSRRFPAATSRWISPPSASLPSPCCPCLDSSSWRREKQKQPSQSDDEKEECSLAVENLGLMLSVIL